MGKRLPVNFVPKGWGYESWIVNNDDYCGKILFFKKGKQCSWHYHKDKSETFYIHEGKLVVTYGDSDDIYTANHVELEAGDCFDVPVGMRHQMYAVVDTVLYEFSTHHKDEDSYRVTKGD
jgi:mannose-6-phosphate isomerase-like protein (cupin superfamily)